jgi:hypothetical protein
MRFWNKVIQSTQKFGSFSMFRYKLLVCSATSAHMNAKCGIEMVVYRRIGEMGLSGLIENRLE